MVTGLALDARPRPGPRLFRGRVELKRPGRYASQVTQFPYGRLSTGGASASVPVPIHQLEYSERPITNHEDVGS